MVIAFSAGVILDGLQENRILHHLFIHLQGKRGVEAGYDVGNFLFLAGNRPVHAHRCFLELLITVALDAAAQVGGSHLFQLLRLGVRKSHHVLGAQFFLSGVLQTVVARRLPCLDLLQFGLLHTSVALALRLHVGALSFHCELPLTALRLYGQSLVAQLRQNFTRPL